jgi:colanic acid biosynthesis glycosyl transferase WcaI
LHIQDFELDVAFNQGQLKSKVLSKFLFWFERALFSRYDRVSSISEKMLQRLLTKGVEGKNIRSVPNWVDLGHIRVESSRGSDFRAALGIDKDHTVVLFSGSLGRKQGLSVVPELANLLKSETQIVFVICGSGPMKEELEGLCKSLNNVRMMPLQPVERLSELLSMADIHFLPQSADASDLVMPSKLSGMLASGRPVIATSAPDTEIAAVLKNCGLVLKPGDLEGLAAAIIYLSRNPDERAKLGAAARNFAEGHFEKDRVLERLDSDLKAAAARRKLN